MDEKKDHHGHDTPTEAAAVDSSGASDGPPNESHEPTTTSKKATVAVVTGDSERELHGVRWFLVCAAIFSANMLFGLDTTIVADIQGAISESYGDVTRLGWLGVGFTLGSTVGSLPLGKAFGIFDAKWVFISCLVNFAAASALCGAAPSMNAMIVGRVWAGVGGAGMYLGTLNLSTLLSSPKEQPFYVALTGFVYGSGCVLGPIVGGAFADSAATWRWAFYLNLCIFAAGAPVYIFLLPSLPRRANPSFISNMKTMDWLGTLLTAGLYSAFTIAFSFGGVLWEYSDGRTITMIVVWVACTVAFVVTQKYSVLTNPIDRLFPGEFLRDPQLILLYIIMSCGGASLFVSIYYIPLFFLFVYGDSGVEAAVRLLPFICFYVATILTCGAIMSRTGYHVVWFVASGLCLTAGAACMYTVQASTPLSHIQGFGVLLGLGMATSQAGYAVGNLLVRPSRASELIEFLNVSQASSQLIGLAIASAIFQTQALGGMTDVLAPLGFNRDEIQAAVAGARSEVLQQVSPEVRERCLDIIVHAISQCWLLVVAAGSLYTLCSLFLTRSRWIVRKRDEDEDDVVVVVADNSTGESREGLERA
ncbi:major facilitator superfamily domain-containing protein [Chaetomium fimeti]|uniref:Major facilitator superfamily domain-containing protein n=1 Tax=Chaetomium fimeti TaxID=1854472 RepID=A0AAE0HQ80_9PEZI|nr:major facilitator superfamily domain-containing protein [Chaetomium fimeti]